MTSLNLTAAACDTSILFAGEHPEHGIFLALIEHADGWPTYATAIVDGELAPLEALGDDAAARITGITARILVGLTSPQPRASNLTAR